MPYCTNCNKFYTGTNCECKSYQINLILSDNTKDYIPKLLVQPITNIHPISNSVKNRVICTLCNGRGNEFTHHPGLMRCRRCGGTGGWDE